MAAVPPARTRSSGPESHQAREVAESFGTDAGRYDRARPDYPGDRVERIVAVSPGSGPVAVLDVGCGTGIVARQFQAAGCEVLGVDPDERMADQARERGLELVQIEQRLLGQKTKALGLLKPRKLRLQRIDLLPKERENRSGHQ